MEASHYTFTHKELLELMVKKAGLHEGKWMLATTFAFTAGNFGPDEDQIIPGVVVAIQKLGLQRADAGSPAALLVDAAEVNPRGSSD